MLACDPVHKLLGDKRAPLCCFLEWDKWWSLSRRDVEEEILSVTVECIKRKNARRHTQTHTQTVSLLATKSTPPNKSGIMSCKSASISRSRVGVVAAARSSATQPLHHFPLFLLQYHTFFPRPTFRNDLQYSLGISIGRKVEIWLKWTVWTWRVQDDTWTQQHHSCCPTKSTRCRPALSSLAKSCYGLWKPHI